MRIAVVTPAYNVAPYIGQAIASVLAQTHADWEMVVVDDGSCDGTGDAVAYWNDPRLKLIRQDHDGVSAARNRGMLAVDAEALLFLDADDWLAPDAMRELSALLADSPWAVAAAAPCVRVGPDSQPGRVARRAPAGDVLPRLLIRNLFTNGGHLLIRREAAAAAGLFRTNLRYGEDWEYWIRIAVQGEFVATRSHRPMCFARERPGSAYTRMANDPESFRPCMQAIFTNPDLVARFGAGWLQARRRRTEAENAWVVGRELVRHGNTTDGCRWLRQSAAAYPSLKRLAIAAASGWIGMLPARWRGSLRPYRMPFETTASGWRAGR